MPVSFTLFICHLLISEMMKRFDEGTNVTSAGRYLTPVNITVSEMMKRFGEGTNVTSAGRYLTPVNITVSAVSNTKVMSCKLQRFAHY